jgi:hypothetical protein
VGFFSFEEEMKMIIRTDNLPWPIDERLRNLLQHEIAKSGIEENRGVILNFRDPKYDHINGGFHPVEIAVDADGSIKYITDFALYGTPPYVELGKEIDFDFGLKPFPHFSEEYPIQEGRNLYRLWEQNFLSYYEMGVYRQVTVATLG